MNNSLRALLCLPLLLIGACSTLTPPHSSPERFSLDSWQLEGRFAFISPEEKFSASLYWLQDDPRYQVKLTNLFGVTLLDVRGDRYKVAIEADDKLYRSDDPRQLIWELTGWDIPIKNIPRWVTGRPGASISPMSRDQHNRITSFEQDNWHISLDNYRLVSGFDLPHNVTLSRGEIRIKIRINAWKTLI